LAGSKKLRLTLLSFALIISLNSCTNKNQIKDNIIEGPTMGTQYKIVIKSNQSIDLNDISDSIESILIDIDNQMSTYNPNSEISAFNKLEYSDKIKGISISSHFNTVLEKSLYYYELSNGMFDVTIHPLYELWGFQNKDGNLIDEPLKEEVEKLLGQGNIRLKEGELSIDKSLYYEGLNLISHDLSIDVSAIAKGYTVDVISDYIKDLGYFDYFIDIGGEIRVSSTIDMYWDIGIQEPNPDKFGNAIKMVRLSNNSIATSGNYANFIEYLNSGIKRTHIINPKTGYPLEIKEGMIASASIVAPLCIDADALATTLMLLSKDEGVKLIESIDDTEVYLIYFKSGELHTEQSSGFKKYIK